MADVAGLILGTVALASLFNACIELFERFEAGTHYAADYEVACTKLALLKARLSTWGVSLGIDKPGDEHPCLRQHWTTEQEVVSRSLCGIKEIFENTSLLAEKYRLTPRRSRTFRSVVSHQVKRLPSEIEHSANAKRSATAWTVLKRRTVWAIHDKQKFDGFIQDLSFLIENLELVAKRTIMPSPRRNSDPLTPPQTPGAVQKANDPGTGAGEVPRQTVQPPTDPPNQAHRSGDQPNINEIVSELDGEVFTGNQRAKGGAVVMGTVGKSDKRRNLYTGSQRALAGGLATMGNISVEALVSLQKLNKQRTGRERTTNEESTESESDSSIHSQGKEGPKHDWRTPN